MKTTSAAVSMLPIDLLAKEAAKKLRILMQPVIAEMVESMRLSDELKPEAKEYLHSEFMNRLVHAFMADAFNTADSTPATMPTETSRSIH